MSNAKSFLKKSKCFFGRLGSYLYLKCLAPLFFRPVRVKKHTSTKAVNEVSKGHMGFFLNAFSLDILTQ